MAALPEKVTKAWEDREGPIILSTVDGEGIPNAIYVSCVSIFNEETIIVANNKFSKTLVNILSGSKGSILFITKEGKSYQIKGTFEYHKEGSLFENMKKWNPKQDLGFGAAVLNVEEAYTGAEKLL
ncbi:MAG: pyridoxamine 5'-phosphate oxidase family protein [Methylococcales bacterium]